MNKDIYDNYINDMESLFNDLNNFLKDCNVDIKVTKNTTFKQLIKRLDNIIAIKKDKKYFGVETNDRGYIVTLINIDGILENENLPDDISRGYYKYDNGKFVLDERMKLEWR